MSSSEHDLRYAISLRPSPFHSSPHRTESPRPHGPESIANPSAPEPTLPPNDTNNDKSVAGLTTAFEATTPTSETHDPIPRHVSAQDDLERQSLPQYTRENDPYQLSSRIKTTSEIERIKANSSKKREGCVSVISRATGRDAWKARKIQGFYEDQNETIEQLLKPVDEHVRQAKEDQGDNQLKFKIAVHGSFAANVILAALQLYGASSSGSLSLFTTMADALFDPLSNITLIVCNRAVKRVDPRKFPSGKARIETAGNIAFCFLMTIVSSVIIVQSVVEIARGSDNETKSFHLPSVIAVAVAFGTKLALFFYCWSLRNKYSQIRILWEDHRNDLFINGFGILTSVGGSKLRWWIDPAGAIVLSCLIICLWMRTAWSEFQLLIGTSADPNMLQLITYISMTHDTLMIKAIDTVRAYYSGPRLIVEVDIVMDPDRTLRETHDVAEDLQIKLESLPDVERAYVHVDYETSHAPEHFWKKEL
ncbi:cation diffusion facilitator 1 [Rhizodiscina lignyota]|uniref:Cation diffusion facilitator 1 n=1 Tax=Rhizodiscina lignyota TaxID=1504668 RepID=A0A9P4IQU8_9PEZI|nr:cation diffusion facilitator 1 [Rhizodiscina lignyota]